jgi:proteasome beta subunit
VVDSAGSLRAQIFEIAQRAMIDFSIGEHEIPKEWVRREREGKLETMTTVIAFRTADGAIIAADSRATLGNKPHEGAMEKLFAVDEFSTFGTSGFAGDGQLIARLIEREFERFANHFHPPHPKSKANRVAAYLRQLGGCVPVFVTYDRAENRARIFSYDSAGSISEMQNGYASIGSGSEPIRSHVESFAPVIASAPAEAAIPAIVYLLRQAARHDLYTGGDFSIHLVTAKGVRELIVPEALWRLDALLNVSQPPEIEIKMLGMLLAYVEGLKKKYAPAEERRSEDAQTKQDSDAEGDAHDAREA